VGSNTTLAAHPDVTPEEQRNAGGCKSGYNMDQYTRMNPKLRMTAANGLAGHKNAQKMVYPPSLGSLVGLIDGNCLNRLELKLYLLLVAQFKPGGPLQPFLQMCTAKLIMEHPRMVRDFGRNNKMVKKLVESMVKAELAVNLSEASQSLITGQLLFVKITRQRIISYPVLWMQWYWLLCNNNLFLSILWFCLIRTWRFNWRS
jgi:hypothetical protein